jgi:predicted nucleic acid-binding protein
MVRPEIFVCDTSYISAAQKGLRNPEKVAHWPSLVVERIDAATLAITPFTLGEVRAGMVKAQWKPELRRRTEERLASYLLIPLSDKIVDIFAELHAGCLSTGVTITHNDLWIAATAIAHKLPLVTCDETQSELLGLPEAIYLPAAPAT